jgi:hypothetical protein
MHVRRENMHIYIFSLLKYKIYVHLHDSVEGYLYYATVKFQVQIYICIAMLEIALQGFLSCRTGSPLMIVLLLRHISHFI